MHVSQIPAVLLRRTVSEEAYNDASKVSVRDPADQTSGNSSSLFLPAILYVALWPEQANENPERFD